jgi:uncharacterized protein YeeX (DUF496 family)
MEDIKTSVDLSMRRIALIGNILTELGTNPFMYLKGDQGDSAVYVDATTKFNGANSKLSDNFGLQIGNVYWTRYFDHTEVTFQELIITAKIEVIEDRHLRELIQQHYSDVKEMLGIQGYLHQAQKDYLDILKLNGITPRTARLTSDIRQRVNDNQRIKTELLNLLETTIDIVIPLQQIQQKTESLRSKVKEKVDLN